MARRSSSAYRSLDDPEHGGDFELKTLYEEVNTKAANFQWKVKKKKKGAKADNLKKELEMDDHIVDIDELYARLETNPKTGLTTEKYNQFFAEYGPNKLTPGKSTPAIVKFLHHLFGGFSLLLWIGALLCAIGFGLDKAEDFNNLYLGVVLVFVVVVTAVFSFWQDAKSAKVMEGFKKLQPSEAEVLRDGVWESGINAELLVKGDIIRVTSGNKIPADIRIISCSSLKVNNSSLTGESVAQARSEDMTDENPLETKNLAFYSTNAEQGEAIGVVISTGDNTVIGRIAGLASSTESKETPIRREIQHFIKIIATVAIVLGVIFFIFGSFVYDVITNLVFAIGIIVANVPEGLLATVTVGLTLTAKRMARKKVLVKNLESVETLGSTSVICSDKTGTLTQNRMTVSHLWYDDKIRSVDTAIDSGTYDPASPTCEALLRIAVVCSTTKFKKDQEDVPVLQREIDGNATEGGLIKFAQPIRDIVDHRAQYLDEDGKPLFAIPFNSTNKFMLTINRDQNKKADIKSPIILLKGAPERVINRCSHILLDGKNVVLDQKMKDAFQEAYDKLGGLGERVLGFAHLVLKDSDFPPDFVYTEDPAPNFPIGAPNPEFVFVGLMSLIDPPRLAVPGAVKTCQEAGIKVIMVTGDHPITAKAIARKVNIIQHETVDEIAKAEGKKVEDIDPRRAKAIVIHGGQLKDMTSDQLDEILKFEEIVFARTSPQQKLLIVEGVQRQGHVVAVTGDGVNDSPALKKADIGIAMGITGSEVSKDAADMILLDDNFASIVKGVKEGRLIFDNLKKSIAYTLSSNIPEILPFILFIVLQIPLPLSTVLILCVDLGTDLIPAISLAYERPESDIMQRKPRNAQTDKLVTSRLIAFSYLQIGVIQALAGMYAYYVVMADYGFPPSSLSGSADDYIDEDFDNFETDDGVFDFDYRERVLQHAQTAYFVSIVVVQWADLLICKTRKLSIFQQGMTNPVMIFGIIFETVLAILIVYLPGVTTALATRPLRFVHWFPAFPFSVLIFTYDEVRKLIIRTFPGGWVERNTYY